MAATVHNHRPACELEFVLYIFTPADCEFDLLKLQHQSTLPKQPTPAVAPYPIPVAPPPPLRETPATMKSPVRTIPLDQGIRQSSDPCPRLLSIWRCPPTFQPHSQPKLCKTKGS